MVEADRDITPIRKFLIHLIQWGIALLFLLGWELAGRWSLIDPFYFSTPSQIILNTIQWAKEGLLFYNLYITLLEAAVGFISGLILGVSFGFVFAINPTLDDIFSPYITLINALPRIAFAPLIILWFGLGFTSKVVIVISLVFFVFFFNTYEGLKNVPDVILKNARVIGADKTDIIAHIYGPSIIRWAFASLRVAVGFSVIAAILGEYIGASSGIGYLINNAQSQFDSTGVMTGLFVLTMTVAILDFFVRKAQNQYTIADNRNYY